MKQSAHATVVCINMHMHSKWLHTKGHLVNVQRKCRMTWRGVAQQHVRALLNSKVIICLPGKRHAAWLHATRKFASTGRKVLAHPPIRLACYAKQYNKRACMVVQAVSCLLWMLLRRFHAVLTSHMRSHYCPAMR